MRMVLKLKSNGVIIAENVILASNFWTRLSGYMFRRNPHVPGILFQPAGAIQTTFMKFNLDLVFLSEKDQIVKIVRNMKPWRFALPGSNATKVIELPYGSLPQEVQEGDFLEIER